ncbi:MAG TPA: hypothetical protein PKH93_12390 [Chitinophagales bacterium]|nr:hypothetical protein [Chitinophagales bacterium]
MFSKISSVLALLLIAFLGFVSCEKETQEIVVEKSTTSKDKGAFSKNLTITSVDGKARITLNISTDEQTGCLLEDYTEETVHVNLLNELPSNTEQIGESTTALEGNIIDESTLIPVHIHVVSKSIPSSAKAWTLTLDNKGNSSRACAGYNGNLNYYYDYTYPFYVSISQPTTDGKCVSAWFQERLNGVWGIYGGGCGGTGGFYLCSTPNMACGGGGNPLRVKGLAPIGTPYTLCNNN